MIHFLPWWRVHSDEIMWWLIGILVFLKGVQVVAWVVQKQINRIRCPNCRSRWTGEE